MTHSILDTPFTSPLFIRTTLATNFSILRHVLEPTSPESPFEPKPHAKGPYDEVPHTEIKKLTKAKDNSADAEVLTEANKELAVNAKPHVLLEATVPYTDAQVVLAARANGRGPDKPTGIIFLSHHS
jgi:hypothetical protein